jgi:hypothetical protein
MANKGMRSKRLVCLECKKSRGDDVHDEDWHSFGVVDLLEGLLEVLGVDAASDLAVPKGFVLALQLDQVQIMQLHHCPLQ